MRSHNLPTCDEPECRAARLPEITRCIEHATTANREEALRRFGDVAQPELNFQNSRISTAHLQDILDAIGREPQSGPTFRDVDFQGAEFEGEADFRGSTFSGLADFRGTRFLHDAYFDNSSFDTAVFTNAEFGALDKPAIASFDNVTFTRYAGFDGASFRGAARFTGGAGFRGDTSFISTRFEGRAEFESADFRPRRGELAMPPSVERNSVSLSFEDAAFGDDANFAGASFGRVSFSRTTFGGHATFDGAKTREHPDDFVRFVQTTFSTVTLSETQFAVCIFDAGQFASDVDLSRAEFGSAVFRDVIFSKSLLCGPRTFTQTISFSQVDISGPFTISCSVSGRIDFENVIFRDRVDWRSTSESLSLVGSRLLQGGFAQVGAQTLDLEGCDFSGPLVITTDVEQNSGSLTRIVSLERANVAGLTLTNVDLSACSFSGAIGLERLVIDGAQNFDPAPGRWRARRRVLAEEHVWRNRRRPSKRHWRWPLPTHVPANDNAPDALRLASVYRSLRVGRESAGDGPGAADFYYGEMEMRRHGGTQKAQISFGERIILTLYWVFSGYGLRAWRSFAFLLGLLLVSVLVVASSGITTSTTIVTGQTAGVPVFQQSVLTLKTRTTADAEPLDRRVSLAAGTLLEAVVFRSTSTTLSSVGNTTVFLVKVFGSLFLGLGLLAVRGRVKR